MKILIVSRRRLYRTPATAGRAAARAAASEWNERLACFCGGGPAQPALGSGPPPAAASGRDPGVSGGGTSRGCIAPARRLISGGASSYV